MTGAKALKLQLNCKSNAVLSYQTQLELDIIKLKLLQKKIAPLRKYPPYGRNVTKLQPQLGVNIPMQSMNMTNAQ